MPGSGELFSLAESVWLAYQGHDDVLLAYPSTSAQGFADLVAAGSTLTGQHLARYVSQ